MKKLFVIFLAAVMMFSICGCGKAETTEETGGTTESTTTKNVGLSEPYEEPPEVVAYLLAEPVDSWIRRIIFSAEELAAFAEEMRNYFGEGENLNLFMRAAEKYAPEFFGNKCLVFLTFEKSLTTSFDGLFFQFTVKEPPYMSRKSADRSRLYVLILYDGVRISVVNINYNIDAAAFLTVDRELVAGFSPNCIAEVNSQ